MSQGATFPDRGFIVYESNQKCLDSEDFLVKKLRSGEQWVDPLFKSAEALDTFIYPRQRFVTRMAYPCNLVEWNRVFSYEIANCVEPRTLKQQNDEDKEDDDDNTDQAKERKSQLRSKSPGTNDDSTLLVQGRLADGWLANAVSLFTASSFGRRYLLQSVLLSERHLQKHGIYTVRLFYEGSWIYTHLDDRIPCNTEGVPLYSRNADANCAWMCLLEKAFAKLLGGYACLNYGSLDFVIRCLTGGVLWWKPLHHATVSVCRRDDGTDTSQTYHRRSSNNNRPSEGEDPTWTQVSQFLQASPDAVVGVLASDPASALFNGHVYAINDVFELLVQNSSTTNQQEQNQNGLHGIEFSDMLRLACLQRGFAEAGGDGMLDQRWKLQHSALLQQLDLSYLRSSNTFFVPTVMLGTSMQFILHVDFLVNQNDNNSSVTATSLSVVPKHWANLPSVTGAWTLSSKTKGTGGSPNSTSVEKWCQNPMHSLILTASVSRVVVVLQQFGVGLKEPAFPIGLHICEAEVGLGGKVARRLWVETAPVAKVVGHTEGYRKAYSVTCQVDALKAGIYVIVPSTLKDGCETSYSLDVHVYSSEEFVRDLIYAVVDKTASHDQNADLFGAESKSDDGIDGVTVEQQEKKSRLKTGGLCRSWMELNELNDAAEVARDLLGTETREMHAIQMQVARLQRNKKLNDVV